MKKTVFIFIAAVISLQMTASSAFAQYITQSLPVEDRVRSIEIIEVKRKVKDAKDVIEKHGDKAFQQFRNANKKWLGNEAAIFVAEATDGSKEKGVFVLYPDVTTVGKDAIDMRRVNGRHFVKDAKEKHDQAKENKVWFGFITGEAGTAPHASTIAISPDGKHYAIGAGSTNLEQEKHFLVSLVNAACDIIKQDGEKAFQILEDKDSVFRLNDSYIYVFSVDGKMLSDPEHPDFLGSNISNFPAKFPGYVYPVYSSTFGDALAKAASGEHPKTVKDYVAQRKQTLIKNGYAWSAYKMTDPSDDGKLYRKVSYDKIVTGPDGKQYWVGSGVFVVVGNE
ncbi:MAG: cache domain-containing protein [Candidatus Tantalella remota]|nr:cache domain-containing protein [Candidatus Tantalella remota]